jgi:hypothetical protein
MERRREPIPQGIKEVLVMVGCKKCKFNLGPAPQVGVKCSNLEKVRDVDAQLYQHRFEHLFEKFGYIMLYEKEVCSFGEPKK